MKKDSISEGLLWSRNAGIKIGMGMAGREFGKTTSGVPGGP